MGLLYTGFSRGELINIQTKLRKFLLAAIIMGVLVLVFFLGGFRFDARQAAKVNQNINEGSILLGEADMGSHRISFYQNEDKYYTILTNRFILIWKNDNASFWLNKTTDTVKLVGWCSYAEDRDVKGLTAIAIQSYDNNVKYVEMGAGSARIIKNTSYGETIMFTWEKSIRWNDLNAIAYSTDGKPLYKLGYVIIDNTIKADELRWLPI